MKSGYAGKFFAFEEFQGGTTTRRRHGWAGKGGGKVKGGGGWKGREDVKGRRNRRKIVVVM